MKQQQTKKRCPQTRTGVFAVLKRVTVLAIVAVVVPLGCGGGQKKDRKRTQPGAQTISESDLRADEKLIQETACDLASLSGAEISDRLEKIQAIQTKYAKDLRLEKKPEQVARPLGESGYQALGELIARLQRLADRKTTPGSDKALPRALTRGCEETTPAPTTTTQATSTQTGTAGDTEQDRQVGASAAGTAGGDTAPVPLTLSSSTPLEVESGKSITLAIEGLVANAASIQPSLATASGTAPTTARDLGKIALGTTPAELIYTAPARISADLSVVVHFVSGAQSGSATITVRKPQTAQPQPGGGQKGRRGSGDGTPPRPQPERACQKATDSMVGLIRDAATKRRGLLAKDPIFKEPLFWLVDCTSSNQGAYQALKGSLAALVEADRKAGLPGACSGTSITQLHSAGKISKWPKDVNEVSAVLGTVEKRLASCRK